MTKEAESFVLSAFCISLQTKGENDGVLRLEGSGHQEGAEGYTVK